MLNLIVWYYINFNINYYIRKNGEIYEENYDLYEI